ncbi:HAD family hydrolase, partial [Flavihumibacter sediminis]|nr:HAD family hydrolase [Flavihumibacter sediminis]
TQQEIQFRLVGLIAFYDPPKPGIQKVLETFYDAGIKVKILTGDNALTTQSIAKEINFRGSDTVIEGNELVKLSDAALKQEVEQYQLYARLFPEAKLRII